MRFISFAYFNADQSGKSFYFEIFQDICSENKKILNSSLLKPVRKSSRSQTFSGTYPVEKEKWNLVKDDEEED